MNLCQCSPEDRRGFDVTGQTDSAADGRGYKGGNGLPGRGLPSYTHGKQNQFCQHLKTEYLWKKVENYIYSADMISNKTWVMFIEKIDFEKAAES